MEEIGRQLAQAHATAVDRDESNIPHLLSPRQVAQYHHEVFKKYGIPPYLFGGTLPVGLYVPDLFGGFIVFEASAPVPRGWGTIRFDANSYRGLWCDGCDTDLKSEPCGRC